MTFDTAFEEKHHTLPVNEDGNPICYVCRRSARMAYDVQAHEVRGHGYRVHLCALGLYGLHFRHQGCNNDTAKERRRKDHERDGTPCSAMCCPVLGRQESIRMNDLPQSEPQHQLELA